MINNINNEIKDNKKCNINVKNVYAPDDKIAKYNIVDEDIKNKQEIEEEFSKRIKYTEKVYSMQLPKELQEDFEIKSEKIGNNMEFLTKPKTIDAYEKFPPKIRFSYNLSNVKGLENFKAKNFLELTREMYEKQTGIVIENPYNIKEFLGDIENPASIFSDINFNAKSTIYIQPHPFPPAIAYNIRLFNNYFDFELRKIMLRIEKIDGNIYTYSNFESKEDKFDVKIVINFYEEKLNFSIKIKIKDEYVEDCEIVSEFIKYCILIEDIDSNLLFQFYEDNETIFETKNFGKKRFSRIEYKKVKKQLNFLEKMIFIEKRKNIKFKYNGDELLQNKEYIYMIYNEVQDRNYTLTNPTTWILESYEDAVIDEDIEKIYNNKEPILIETSIKDINIFGTNIKLKEHKLCMENCIVDSIEKRDSKYFIKVTTNRAKFKIIKQEV